VELVFGVFGVAVRVVLNESVGVLRARSVRHRRGEEKKID
jgi:hypothetical protein